MPTRGLPCPPVLVPGRELILLVPDVLPAALIPIRIAVVRTLPGAGRRGRPLLKPHVPCAPLPHGANHRGRDVSHAAHGRHDGIRDGEGRWGARGVEAHATVHDAHEEQDAAVPDVGIGDRGADLVLDVVAVVEDTEDRLYDHGGDNDGAEDGVSVSEELGDVSEVKWTYGKDGKLTVPAVRAVI